MLQIDAFQWCCINFYQNVQRMKQSLPRELEKHLKKKCWGLLSYYQPEWGTVSRYLLACSFKLSLTFSTFISRHCSALTGNKGCCLVFFFLFVFFSFFQRVRVMVWRTQSCLIYQPSWTKRRKEQRVWKRPARKMQFFCKDKLNFTSV